MHYRWSPNKTGLILMELQAYYLVLKDRFCGTCCVFGHLFRISSILFGFDCRFLREEVLIKSIKGSKNKLQRIILKIVRVLETDIFDLSL